MLATSLVARRTGAGVAILGVVLSLYSRLWQMWETAERAGLITANLMWSVSLRYFFTLSHEYC